MTGVEWLVNHWTNAVVFILTVAIVWYRHRK